MADSSTSAAVPASVEDPRVSAILQEYLSELERGHRPERAAFLARHPELAGPLGEALDGLEFVHGAVQARPRLPESAPVPAMLGDFRIIREVGRGGMGVVYEAEQISLQRRVALKVLPFAAALDQRHLHRFRNEAQAAAHLHHSHIVPVFAVGSDRGVHYYAMQFIDGQSLAELIRSWRRLDPGLLADSSTGSYHPASPPALSSTRERAAATTAPFTIRRDFMALARFGVQAADALEYAHAMGVVHRDIKPANLLVDARGHLWVADFGLAQMHGVHDLTVSGDVLGTLRYMSPEQASGRRGVIDHHADIYSLGVTLYELLTLRDPYPARNREDLLRRILHDEPLAPRKACRDLPVELETILLKAMSKNPSERYATAQDLADDLRRFIDDRPVLARRPTLAQVAGKWARRHRGFVHSAVLLVCLGCVALAVVAWTLHRSRQQTEQALHQARSAWQASRRAFDTLYEAADKAVTDSPKGLPERRAFLERALDFYERFASEFGDDPIMRFEQARAYVSVGNIRLKLGDFAKVGESYTKARQILEPMTQAPGSSVECRRLLAECCNSEGILAAQTGKTDAAIRAFRRAAELQQSILERNPDDERAQFSLAKHTSNIGATYLEEHKYDAAREALTAALAHLERSMQAKLAPNTADLRQLALNHHNLGVVNHRTRQIAAAREHWIKALEICDSLVREHPFDAQFLDARAASTLSLGVLLYDCNEFADAERFFRDAQATYAKLMTQFPSVPSYRSEHGRCTHGLARSLKEQGKIGDARQVLAGSEELLERLTREYPEVVAYRVDLLKSRIDHANLLADAGQLAEADAVARLAWSEAAEGERRLPPTPDVRAHWLALRNNMSDYAWRAGRRDEALDGFRSACVIGEKLVAEFPAASEYRDNLLGVRSSLARLLQQMGRFVEAEVVVQSLLSDCEALAAETQTRARALIHRAWALSRLAQVCSDRENEAAVRLVWREAVASADRAADEFPKTAFALAGASWFLSMCPNIAYRDPEKALRFAERAAQLESDSPDVARTLGLAQLRAGDADAAIESLQRARRLFRHRDLLTDLLLAMALAESGRMKTARGEFDHVCRRIVETREQSEDVERLRAEADAIFAPRK